MAHLTPPPWLPGPYLPRMWPDADQARDGWRYGMVAANQIGPVFPAREVVAQKPIGITLGVLLNEIEKRILSFNIGNHGPRAPNKRGDRLLFDLVQIDGGTRSGWWYRERDGVTIGAIQGDNEGYLCGFANLNYRYGGGHYTDEKEAERGELPVALSSGQVGVAVRILDASVVIQVVVDLWELSNVIHWPRLAPLRA